MKRNIAGFSNSNVIKSIENWINNQGGFFDCLFVSGSLILQTNTNTNTFSH